MALRGTLHHWKTKLLAETLGIDPCYAMGVLEALWHATAELAPAGNIGRLPNLAIASQMGSRVDPDRLIAALVRSGHLDEHPEHRLMVHDWHLHSDDAADNKLSRAGQRYANGAKPRMRRLSKAEREKADALYAEQDAAGTATDAGTPQVVPSQSVRTHAHMCALPEPVPKPEPEPNPPLPLPRGGERFAGGMRKPPRGDVLPGPELVAATDAVMLGCGFVDDRRLRPVIVAALTAACSSSGDPPHRWAEVMRENWAEYQRCASLLRYTCGARKFIAEGHWRNPRGWPVDREALAQERRARM